LSQKFDAIIITSDEPYGLMWHTQLIYADFLSKDTPVFYIAAPKKWTPANVFKRIHKKTVIGSLRIIDYLNIYPSQWNDLNDKLLAQYILTELKEIQARKILIWHFDSFRSSFKEKFFSDQVSLKRIYHVIDPFYHNPINDWLSRHADILALTSERNKVYYQAYDEKTIIVPQAIDLDLHNHYLEKDPKSGLPKKFAVLLGSISDDVDIQLLHSLFSGSGIELVVIGKAAELPKQQQHWEKLIALPNIHYRGILPPQDFYPILKRAFAGLIIYTAQKQKQVSSPLKVLNYLVAGLPVITNLNCEIDQLIGQGIYEAKNETALREDLKKASRNDLKINKEAVDKYLNEVSLQNIIHTLYARL